MKQALLAVALAILALGACKREAAPAPAAQTAPAAPVTTQLPAATDTTGGAVDASPAGNAAVAFDNKAFAGRFATTGSSLEILADGGYRLALRAESANADMVTDGTWTLEPDGRHLLLDPSSKAEPDRRYEIIAQDELRAVDGGQTLRRKGTTP